MPPPVVRKTTAQRLFDSPTAMASDDDENNDASKTAVRTTPSPKSSSYPAPAPAAFAPFQWKSVESLMTGNVSEEQVQRQLISLHR